MLRRRTRGFALVIVLWVLAGLTVVAVAVASSVRTSSEGLKLLRDRVRAEADFMSSAARVKVLTSTAGPTRAAFHGPHGWLFADGRALGAGADDWVLVQDTGGLVQLGRVNETRLLRLLRDCSAGDLQARRLVDALLDYVDVDSLKRANGAEAFDYAGTELPPPRNSSLLSMAELWRIKGWPEFKPLWDSAQCRERASLRGDGTFNRNTASLPALLADGMDATVAASVIGSREDGFADTTLALSDATAEASNPFNFAGGGFVGSVVRVRHFADWLQWGIEYELELTPSRGGGPWRVHEMRVLARRDDLVKPQATLPATNFWDPARNAELDSAATNLPFAN